MNTNLLTIDDATKVAMRFLKEYSDCEDGDGVEDIVFQEMEQKCRINATNNGAWRHLNDLVFDINPAEICQQIRNDNLKQWCLDLQVAMRMELIKLPMNWGDDG